MGVHKFKSQAVIIAATNLPWNSGADLSLKLVDSKLNPQHEFELNGRGPTIFFPVKQKVELTVAPVFERASLERFKQEIVSHYFDLLRWEACRTISMPEYKYVYVNPVYKEWDFPMTQLPEFVFKCRLILTNKIPIGTILFTEFAAFSPDKTITREEKMRMFTHTIKGEKKY